MDLRRHSNFENGWRVEFSCGILAACKDLNTPENTIITDTLWLNATGYNTSEERFESGDEARSCAISLY